MNRSLIEIKAILNNVRPELMKKKNVVATGIGYKKVGNQMTRELAIICSVEVKNKKSNLRSSDLIPAEIQDIPTDVNPTGPINMFQNPTERFRPAPGGVSIGHYQITAGTIGCLVKKEGETYILSNNHVLANSNEAAIGDVILQPGAFDGGNIVNDQIAVLSDFVPISFETGGGNGTNPPCAIGEGIANSLNFLAKISGSTTRLRTYRIQQTDNKVDCAIAKPLNENDVSNEILQIGPIAGVQEGTLGTGIKKSGRTTGLTTGVIEQVDVSVRVGFGTNKSALFVDQLLAGAMSSGGDSGSTVLSEDNNIVGLLFAGSQNTTVINRISNVFDALKVTLL